jgi:pyruvate dehydrogenase E2 component (dihydrolipoamide acetyltransferase)
VAIEIVRVPDLGGAETVDVIELSLAQGDNIAIEDSLIVLESDKATMDVPSPYEGQLVKYLVAEGDTVKIGDPIAELEVSSSESVTKPEAEEPVQIEAAESQVEAPVVEEKSVPDPEPRVAEPANIATEVEPSPDGATEADIYAGPSVRLMARELGVGLGSVVGSGPRGRIIKDDIDAYVKNALKSNVGNNSTTGSGIPAIPAVDFSRFGAVDTVKLSKIQKLTAANMHRNWLNVPHVTHFDDADITDLENFRKSLKAEGESRGTRITPVSFIIKAIAMALSANPVFNRSLAPDGDHYIQKAYCNIGMAVDTPRGLMVPVVTNADEKGIWEIAANVADLATKARDGKLQPLDMQGGCFSLSSLGAIGGNGFTPIVNAPEAGILGVSKSQMKPVWNGDTFEPRLMLPMALSYDHRLVNGGDAGRFMTDIVKFLSDIRHLVL